MESTQFEHTGTYIQIALQALHERSSVACAHVLPVQNSWTKLFESIHELIRELPNIPDLESRPSLHHHIVHVGRAEVGEIGRQGDEIDAVDTPVVLTHLLVLGVRVPAMRMELAVELLVVCHGGVGVFVHEHLVPHCWPGNRSFLHGIVV